MVVNDAPLRGEGGGGNDGKRYSCDLHMRFLSGALGLRGQLLE
jgi:hypothetical protein